MNEDTKLSDLTVAEFRKIMQECLRKHESDSQHAKYSGRYPDEAYRGQSRQNVIGSSNPLSINSTVRMVGDPWK
jgi:hypothetical protein